MERIGDQAADIAEIIPFFLSHNTFDCTLVCRMAQQASSISEPLDLSNLWSVVASSISQYAQCVFGTSGITRMPSLVLIVNSSAERPSTRLRIVTVSARVIGVIRAEVRPHAADPALCQSGLHRIVRPVGPGYISERLVRADVGVREARQNRDELRTGNLGVRLERAVRVAVHQTEINHLTDGIRIPRGHRNIAKQIIPTPTPVHSAGT